MKKTHVLLLVCSVAHAHICFDAVAKERKPYAIVTLVDGDGYVRYTHAVNVLWQSLSATLDTEVFLKTEFILLTSRTEHLVGLDEEWKKCHIPDLYHPYLNKQWVFLMDDFERVLYMDADTFAWGDVSPMLTDPSQENVSVTADWFDSETQLKDHAVGFNTGIFSFKPGKMFHDLFFGLQAALDAGKNVNDQSEINTLLKSWPKTWFNFSFNAWLNGLDELDGTPVKPWNNTLWDMHEPMRVYHLIGNYPPPRPPPGATSRRGIVYERWWHFHNALHARRLDRHHSLTGRAA